MGYEAVVVGVSAGGLAALKVILPALPANFALPIAIVQHRSSGADDFLVTHLNSLSKLTVKEAEDKEPIQQGHIYIAPGGYHLLIEADRSFSLSLDERVNYSCPSVDVLFESAADVYRNTLIGLVLTGANADGSRGLALIKYRGGLAIVQDPNDAEARAMPQAALVSKPDHVVPLEQIAPLLVTLSHEGEADGSYN